MTSTLRLTPLFFLLVFGSTPRSSAQGCVDVPDGLVSWWPGDGNATDIEDGNNGVLQNGATFGPGQVGSAFDLGGELDHVSIPHSANLGFTTNDAYTIELWMKTDVVTVGHPAMVEKWTNANFPNVDYPYVVRLNTGDTDLNSSIGPVGTVFCASFSAPDFPFVWSAPGSRVDDGAFHHVACVWDHPSRTLTVYVDGQLSGSTTYPSPLGSISNDVPLLFGVRTGERGPILLTDFDGVLDEVSIYERALGEAEIADLFFAGRGGKCKLQLIDALIGRVEALVDNGELARSHARGLLATLDAVVDKIRTGKSRAAINQLRAFVRQVEGLVGAGRLPGEPGEELVDLADAVAAQIDANR